MACTISLLSERHFLCSLCEDIFSSPVTTPCGHSFCKVCLRKYWNQSGSNRCPVCKRTFSTRPHLSINHILADVTENYRKNFAVSRSKALSEDILSMNAQRSEAEVQQMIQERLRKMERLNNSLELLESSCLREVQESQSIFSTLVKTLEMKHKMVVAAVEEKQREAQKRVDRLLKELEKEILELEGGKTDLGHQRLNDKEYLKRSFHQLPVEFRDWSRVTVETDPCVGFTRRAVMELMETTLVEVNRLSRTEVKRLQKYSVEITLNPRTAHVLLSISDDRKQVTHSDKRAEVPESSKRFDRVINVLGKESFSSGRHYWEVGVKDKTEWDLGVANQSVNRKGKFSVCPANGFWTVSLRNGSQYIANTSPPTPLSIRFKPKKVAVYLDHEAGHVSFYCLDSGAHIHTFTGTFTDSLHPIFSPGKQNGSKNIAPLTIISNHCSI